MSEAFQAESIATVIRCRRCDGSGEEPAPTTGTRRKFLPRSLGPHHHALLKALLSLTAVTEGNAAPRSAIAPASGLTPHQVTSRMSELVGLRLVAKQKGNIETRKGNVLRYRLKDLYWLTVEGEAVAAAVRGP